VHDHEPGARPPSRPDRPLEFRGTPKAVSSRKHGGITGYTDRAELAATT
jgi:hypothetical protein